MFCMGCGAELRPHADTCSVCGLKVGDAPTAMSYMQARSGRLPLPAAGEVTQPLAAEAIESALRPAVVPSHSAGLVAAGATSPSIGYGDVNLLSIPRDAPGRLVLVLSLLLAADLQAPWVALDGTHVAPSRFSLPVLLVTGLLMAAAVSVIYTPFRQRAYFVAYPLVLGAAALGAAATLTLMVGPLASPLTTAFVAHVLASPVVAQNLANPDPLNAPPTIALAADTGLYVFLIGSAILTVAGYQLLVAMAENLAGGMGAAGAASLGGSGANLAAGRIETASAAATPEGHMRGSASLATPVTSASVVPIARGRGMLSDLPAPPQTADTSPDVILPGTEGWNRAPEAPTARRNTSSSRGLRGGPR